MSIFDKVRLKAPERSMFVSHPDNKLTLNMGYNVPVFCNVFYPSDELKVSAEHLIRFAPMLAPVFSKYDVHLDSFKYPVRLLWSKGLDFFKGGKDGQTDYAVPKLSFYQLLYASAFDNWLKERYPERYYNPDSSGSFPTGEFEASGLSRNYLIGSLIDYLNLPTFDYLLYQSDGSMVNVTIGDALSSIQSQLSGTDFEYINILPFMAYQGIYREYYRNQFLQEVDNVDAFPSNAPYFPDIDADDFILLVQGTSSMESALNYLLPLMRIRDVNYNRDYFTSSYTSPQSGPAVRLPVGNLPVGTSPFTSGSYPYVGSRESNGEFRQAMLRSSTTQTTGYNLFAYGSHGDTTIPDLRKANKLQEYLERILLAGNRPIEWIKAIFGVESSDARLDRPEFLGRRSSNVSISSILQTSGSTGNDNSLGDFAGEGISVDGDFLFQTSFEEPSYVFILMSVKPKTSYFQGIPRHFTKDDRFDCLIPQFAGIGMQPVFTKEIFAGKNSDGTLPNDVFGYQTRYAEYKFFPSEIHGDFRGSMLYWHSARNFKTAPVLSSQFISVDNTNQDIDRIFADTTPSDHKLFALLQFHIEALRPLPEYDEYNLL